MVKFLKNTWKWYPRPHPWWWDMGSLKWSKPYPCSTSANVVLCAMSCFLGPWSAYELTSHLQTSPVSYGVSSVSIFISRKKNSAIIPFYNIFFLLLPEIFSTWRHLEVWQFLLWSSVDLDLCLHNGPHHPLKKRQNHTLRTLSKTSCMTHSKLENTCDKFSLKISQNVSMKTLDNLWKYKNHFDFFFSLCFRNEEKVLSIHRDFMTEAKHTVWNRRAFDSNQWVPHEMSAIFNWLVGWLVIEVEYLYSAYSKV